MFSLIAFCSHTGEDYIQQQALFSLPIFIQKGYITITVLIIQYTTYSYLYDKSITLSSILTLYKELLVPLGRYWHVISGNLTERVVPFLFPPNGHLFLLAVTFEMRE